MSALALRNRQRARALDLRLLRRIVLVLLRDFLTIEAFDLGLYLVESDEIIALNQTFLRHAGPTDVIAFDYTERAAPFSLAARKSHGGGLPPDPGLHGEIFVCVEQAGAQSRRFRTTWQAELARYIIHGLLHLQGYDDRRPSARRKMKREEDRLLRRVSRAFDLKKLG